MSYRDGVASAIKSISLLGGQFQEGYRVARAASFPAAYRRASHVLVCGMGGSALGADLVRHAMASSLRKPISIVNGYDLPSWVNRQTLVVCSSYSGGTRETLECFRRARQARVPLVAIAGGGKLAAAAQRARVPLVQFDDRKLNPSQQPRLGTGFSIGALIALLENIGALATSTYKLAHPAAVPAAAARVLSGRAVAVLGVGYLAGAAHLVANCINENSKAFAAPFALPEADHHLLEGLRLPERLPLELGVLVLVPSPLDDMLQVQYRATVAVLAKHKIPVLVQRFSGVRGGPLAAALAAAGWGAKLSVSLAEAAKLDPLAIPWVKWLKQQQDRG